MTESRSRLVVALTWLMACLSIGYIWAIQCLAGALVLGIAPASWTMHLSVRNTRERGEPLGWRASWIMWRSHFAEAQRRLLVPYLTLLPIMGYLMIATSTLFAVTILVVLVAYAAWLAWLPAVASEAPPETSVTQIWYSALGEMSRKPLTVVGLAAIGPLLAGAVIVFALPALPVLIVASAAVIGRARASRTDGYSRRHMRSGGRAARSLRDSRTTR